MKFFRAIFYIMILMPTGFYVLQMHFMQEVTYGYKKEKFIKYVKRTAVGNQESDTLEKSLEMFIFQWAI